MSESTESKNMDIIDQLVGIQPGSTVAELRARRPDVTLYAQSSYETLFAPADFAGLTLGERLLAALRVAALEASQPLIAHYRPLLQQSGAAPEVIAAIESDSDLAALSSRQAAIVRHADLLTLAPASAAPEHLAALQAAGLSTRNIVTLAQLIAFLSFQVRTVAALALFSEQRPAISATANVARRDHEAKNSRPVQQEFTLDSLGWDAWLDTLKLAEATPDQIAVLEESTPTAKTSPYYLLLVQDVDVLRARSRLYNAIMYGPRGLTRADRELGALTASRINGCPYCASIHAQRFSQLTKQPDIVTRLWQEGVQTALEPRHRAIVDFSAKLSDFPSQLTSADLLPLRQVDFSDWEIFDLANAVAMFAWANRLMQTLGEPVPVP